MLKVENLVVHYGMIEAIKGISFTINDGDVTPVYKTMKGWHTSLSNVHHFNEMPQELVDYIDFLEQELQVPITIVSTGPDRTQTLIKQEVAV